MSEKIWFEELCQKCQYVYEGVKDCKMIKWSIVSKAAEISSKVSAMTLFISDVDKYVHEGD